MFELFINIHNVYTDTRWLIWFIDIFTLFYFILKKRGTRYKYIDLYIYNIYIYHLYYLYIIFIYNIYIFKYLYIVFFIYCAVKK